MNLLIQSDFMKDFKKVMYKYIEKIDDVVEHFKTAIGYFNEMRVGEARRELASSMDAEKEADELRRKMVYLLETSEINPELKEDLFHLIKRIEVIADFVKDAASTLTIIPYLEVPVELREGYEKMINKVYEATKKVCKAVEALLEGEYTTASRLADEVEALEEEADMIDVDNRGKLLDYGEKLKPYTLAILLHDLILDLEEAANACEDAADYIRALIVVYSEKRAS